MAQSLPLILSAGLFDSNHKFPGLTRTQLRLVTTYELEYFSASGGVTVINGKEYPLRGGRLLLSKPGDFRCSQLPFQCRFIHFDVSDPAVCEVLNNCCGYIPVSNPKDTEEAFSRIAELYYATNPLDRLSAGAELVLLLKGLCTASLQDQSTACRAQKYIESNYREDLSVSQIAESCGVSPSYLHRIFQTRLHTTPGELILSCRIAAASNLLVSTSLTLAEIASRCGFHSPSYFSDCFKRKTGHSPNSFRKNAAYPL